MDKFDIFPEWNKDEDVFDAYKNIKHDIFEYRGDPLFSKPDMVNHPPHYTRGRFEAIEVIEDAIKDAPHSEAAFNQGQALKYLLRLWNKVDAKEDAEKARWYLNRLINHLDDRPDERP